MRIDHTWLVELHTLIDPLTLLIKNCGLALGLLDYRLRRVVFVDSCKELVPPFELLDLAIKLLVAVLRGYSTFLAQVELH